MSNLRMFLLFALILTIGAWYPIYSQDDKGKQEEPTTLDDYQLVARGNMSQERGARPGQIARLDNNGEILLACVEAQKIKQLKSSGIKFRQSQLELLVDWNLLAYDVKSKAYKTTIHIYGPEKAAAIRQLAGTVVAQLSEELKEDLDLLKSHLKNTGSEKSMFSVLYAYILHGYAMEQFGEEIYRKPQLSPKNPYWNGYAWAIFPIKKFDTGVSVLPGEGKKLFFVSAKAVTGPKLKQIMELAKAISVDGNINNPELQKTFEEFDILDEQGKLTIPVFDAEWSEKLEIMAVKVYAKILELTKYQKTYDIIGVLTPAQAAMFLHYEIRYAFLSALLENGTIAAPLDFNNPKNNKPADFGNLIFLMVNKIPEKKTSP